ncbi:MAG TPA: biotin carboxylase N-terminal domain-containing protein [Roseiarcus sp.]|nr:biotin carboxylase N-terminal domain-containing protein [Roseiarcus sp.]
MSAPRPLPFRKVLIANRGEIACRILRTLRGSGLASVAIHHAVEAGSPHARMADEAIEVFGDTPVAAHLDGDEIIAAALRVGADAIHPGYGFLSENARFAAAVEKAGLAFIGPDARTIALMGDKISARDFARAQGLPVAPSITPSRNGDAFLAQAATLGFPLIIKAAAGGGGKGMSVVRAPAQLREAARIAASEAQRYFGDGRIYAETYVERPRHIEVQIAGDGEGDALHLHERECSVQRRFQKIIEEAPAPNLDPGLRADICAAAVRLAAAARYRNLGTVEFILGADGRFFFLEMNTRLQVEHPVTEEITGLDLVRLQLEIVAGFGLGDVARPAPRRGHAIECRICAEDPERDFLPETGTLAVLQAPCAPYLRFENALRRGQTITSDFDPLLAKLVVHGADRDEAIDRAVAALGELALLGVKTNIDYLACLINHPAFRAGDLHTGFINQHAAELGPPAPDEATTDAAAIAAALGFRGFRDAVFDVPEPYASIGGWRN